MKKILFILLAFFVLTITIKAQYTVNPFTGKLDNNGNLSKSYVSAGVAYFIIKGDTVASDTLNGTTALFTQLDRQADSITSLRAATNQNYGFILSLSDTNVVFRQDIGDLRDSIPMLRGLIEAGGGGTGDVTTQMLTDSMALKAYKANPTFTGIVKLSNDTLATQEYARSYGGSGTVTESQVRDIVSDSISGLLANGDTGLALADSGLYTPGGYPTMTMLDNAISSFGSSYDTTYLYSVIASQQSQIDNLMNLLETLGDYDLVAPAFSSASIRNDTVWVTMNKNDIQQDSVPNPSDFYLTEGALQMGITSLTLSDSIITMKLDSAGLYGETYLLDYTRGFPTLQDSSGNRTASWTNKSVTNNVAEITSNMISNGTFDSGTGWTETEDGFIISGGVASYDYNLGTDFIYQIDADMIGSIQPLAVSYTLTGDLNLTSGASAFIAIFSSDGNVTYSGWNTYTGTTISINFTTGSDVGIAGIRIGGNTGCSCTFTLDNIVLTAD